MVISMGGSSKRARTWRISQPAARPTARPPIPLAMNSSPASQSVKDPDTTAATANAVEDQRRPVVGQALALDDCEQPPRGAHAAHDLRGRHGVGGRDDCAQNERLRPFQANNLVNDDRDGGHRRENERDGEGGDRARVAAQLAHRREEGRAVQERREEDQEHDIRVELHGGNTGQESDHRAACHERDRVRNANHSGQHGEPSDREQKPEDDQLDVIHAGRVSASPCHGPRHPLRQTRLPPVR